MSDSQWFDVNKARSDGLSDDQIMQHLSQVHNFDYTSALKDGLTPQQIIDHLSTSEPQSKGVLGQIGSFFTETGHQVGQVAKGIFHRSQETYDPSTGQLKGSPSAMESLGPISAVPTAAYRTLFQPPDAPVTQRLGDFATTMIGGDPERARELRSQGDIGGSLGAMFGVPALTLGAAHFWRRGIESPMDVRQLAAGADLIHRGIRDQSSGMLAAPISGRVITPKFDNLRATSAMMQPIIQQVVKELNLRKPPGPISKLLGKEEGSYGVATSEGDKYNLPGNLAVGGQDVLRAFSQAVEAAQRPLDAALGELGDRPVPNAQSAVVNGLLSKADSIDKVEPKVATAIRGIAQNIKEGGSTVSELNDFKVEANKQLDRIMGLSKSGQIAAEAQAVYAYQYAADLIRQNLYPAIQTMGGPDLSIFGARESAAIQARDGVYDLYYNDVSPNEASRSAKSYWEYVRSGSLYKTHVLKRALGIESHPMEAFNQLFNRYLGRIPGDFEGEQVTPVTDLGVYNTPKTKLLTGSTSPYIFTIHGQPVIDTLHRFTSGDMEPTYIGDRTVPNPNYTSVSDHLTPPQQLPSPNPSGARTSPGPLTARRQLNRELGTPTASTIHNRTVEVRTPEEINANNQYVNTAPGYRINEVNNPTIPERSFTGSATKTESNWQYIPGETDPLPGISGGGTLHTTDPAVVTRTIASISDALKQKLPPSIKSQLTMLRQDLVDQMNQYNAYSNLTPPPSVRIGVKPVKLGTVPFGSVPKRFAAQTSANITSRENQRK